ncbi:hypothetical protein B0T16DRAFT_453715 [Cercophora newfieldiana]|uniref:RGS domain-containing protein n=1 Tax=Cercophora newfieldiana TaxID=92897 RepID=A0AA40CVZ4_9PEZI|nr:hypothetical protein B0T16DRAFT_453715 [Cercophora newfieldiana]
MEDFETAHQLEPAEPPRNIPKELAFEEVIKNRTAPPCSLNDFMDYLVYEEHNAESLQFFLWYYDYLQRWSQLLHRQKALSPMWDPEKATEPRSRFITYSHKRARSQKMNKIITIMEMESETLPEDPFADPEGRRSTSSMASSTHTSGPKTPSSVLLSPGESPKPDWQPFTIQPFRDEISRVVKQYIAESAPRQLNLAPKDRDSCLRAAQHTTHPSALLPAFLVAEANLRSHSHPNFISWATSNGNRPRILFLRLTGLLLVFLGILLDTFLILSRQNPFLRVTCLILWWPGLTILIAACKRLCVILHFYGERQLRPWELFTDAPPQENTLSDDDNESFPSLHEKNNSKSGGGFHKHSRMNSSLSSISSRGADPLRKPSLQPFGPKNDTADEQWASQYKNQSLIRKIVGETTPVQNTSLRLLQDRTVFLAVLWGGLLASALTAASLFVPAGNFYM